MNSPAHSRVEQRQCFADSPPLSIPVTLQCELADGHRLSHRTEEDGGVISDGIEPMT